MSDNYIRNKKGKVAIRYGVARSKVLAVGGNRYTWMPQHNISLAFVNEKDIPYVLSHLKKGCCGSRTLAGTIATQAQVDKWLS